MDALPLCDCMYLNINYLYKQNPQQAIRDFMATHSCSMKAPILWEIQPQELKMGSKN